MIDVFQLSDEELEDCVDGSTNITMLRDILTKVNVVAEDGVVNVEAFASWFAYGLESYIAADEDEEPDEWQEAYDSNEQWGRDIAENINYYIGMEDEV
jgi:hypothetical protein